MMSIHIKLSLFLVFKRVLNGLMKTQTQMAKNYYMWLAERTKNEVISKACEWLKGQLIDNQDNCGYAVVSTFDTTTVEEFICDFKKAMEL